MSEDAAGKLGQLFQEVATRGARIGHLMFDVEKGGDADAALAEAGVILAELKALELR